MTRRRRRRRRSDCARRLSLRLRKRRVLFTFSLRYLTGHSHSSLLTVAYQIPTVDTNWYCICKYKTSFCDFRVIFIVI